MASYRKPPERCVVLIIGRRYIYYSVAAHANGEVILEDLLGYVQPIRCLNTRDQRSERIDSVEAPFSKILDAIPDRLKSAMFDFNPESHEFLSVMSISICIKVAAEKVSGALNQIHRKSLLHHISQLSSMKLQPPVGNRHVFMQDGRKQLTLRFVSSHCGHAVRVAPKWMHKVLSNAFDDSERPHLAFVISALEQLVQQANGKVESFVIAELPKRLLHETVGLEMSTRHILSRCVLIALHTLKRT